MDGKAYALLLLKEDMPVFCYCKILFIISIIYIYIYSIQLKKGEIIERNNSEYTKSRIEFPITKCMGYAISPVGREITNYSQHSNTNMNANDLNKVIYICIYIVTNHMSNFRHRRKLKKSNRIKNPYKETIIFRAPKNRLQSGPL